VIGDCRQARADAAQGLKLERGRASLPRAALALALCGDVNEAKPLVAELSKAYPEDTILKGIWLPAIRVAIELREDSPAAAVRHLETASRYEAAAEFWPQYLRGLAWLKAGRAEEAAVEFQRILDRRGEAPLSVLCPLAKLGAARAAALAGDVEKSRKAFDEFFTLWARADADVPVLSEARKDNARLTEGQR
jgi:predicted Zn-dependent protease